MTAAVRVPPMLPYLQQADFLPPEEHAALLDWTLANAARFAPAELAGGVVDPGARHALRLGDLGPIEAAFAARLRAALPGWIEALRITPFEVSDLQLELVAHNHGAHFVLHSDTYTTEHGARGDRMVSAVYYFHREPKRFDGGCLRLHRLGAKPGDPGIDIAPTQNSLLVFPAWGPHEVMEVSCPSEDFADSRFAVNCWFYRKRVR